MKKIVFVLIALAVVVFLAVFFGGKQNEDGGASNPPVLDPLDTVNPFFNAWLDALQSTSTDPYSLGLANDESLSPEVQQYIRDAQTAGGQVDPVICRQVIPPRIGAKEVFAVEDKAQYLVLPRGVGGISPRRALVDVESVDGVWKIVKITCVNGESAPETEFTFERTGYLLKTDQEPLDPNNWYVVFEENGIDGHHAPLFFSESSECVSPDGSVAVCDPDSFTNASQATVKGEMSEAGVQVVRIEFN